MSLDSAIKYTYAHRSSPARCAATAQTAPVRGVPLAGGAPGRGYWLGMPAMRTPRVVDPAGVGTADQAGHLKGA